MSLAENDAVQTTWSCIVAGLPTAMPGAGSVNREPEKNTSLPSHAGTVVCEDVESSGDRVNSEQHWASPGLSVVSIHRGRQQQLSPDETF